MHAVTGERGAAERVFTAADTTLGLAWPKDQGGLVLMVDAVPRWLAARTPELEAAAVAGWPRVTAVALAPPGADPARVGLAMAFAAHLPAVRRGRPDLGQVFVIAPDRPKLSPGWVRLPHLVTLAAPEPVDDMVWEILPRERAQRWVGRNRRGRRFVEAHLPALVRLRRAARCGHLPDTATARALARALRGRDLSTTFVYEHIRLVSRTLAELASIEHETAPRR
jgi:hypothetical protein